jgi:hypothetical protein
MLKKLITTAALIVGSSTAALAAPYHNNNSREAGHGPVMHVQAQERFRVERPRVEPQRVERTRVERTRIERPRYVRPRAEIRWFQPRIIERPIVETSYVAPTYISSSYVEPAYTADGSQYLSLGNLTGEGIELSGTGMVSQVAVHYADGRTVYMQIGQDVGSTLDLQTDGSAIAGITIYGNASVSAAVI